MTLFENLARKDYGGAAREGDTPEVRQRRAAINRSRALARANEVYSKLHPAAAVKSERARAAAKGEKITANPSGADKPPDEIRSFTEVAAEQTGLHVDSVRRHIRIGGAFTDEQAEVLAEQAVPTPELEKLAAMPTPARTLAVELIESGRYTPVEAVETALAGAAQDAGRPKPVAEKAPDVEAMPEREWLDALSSNGVREQVVRSYFDFHALLWRRMGRARQQFQKQLQREVETLKKEYGDVQASPGSYLALLNRAMGVDQPLMWKKCSSCRGKGVKDEAACRDCGGGGFVFGQAARQKKSRRDDRMAQPAAKATAPSCQGCNGTGLIDDDVCGSCHGMGSVPDGPQAEVGQ
jgi:hypothetical protein